MIAIKTKLKIIPKTCKDCKFSKTDKNYGTYYGSYEVRGCMIKNKPCPMERASNNCLQYTKPKWCPLINIKEDDLNGC